jgi:hypothetical protein
LRPADVYPRLTRRVAPLNAAQRQVTQWNANSQGRNMSTFDKREDTFEKTFVREEELHFRAEARRNKLLGLWAAEKLGKNAAEAVIYANELVAAETAANAGEVVLARVLKDFAAAGIDQSEHQIRRTMEELLVQATAELKAGK